MREIRAIWEQGAADAQVQEYLCGSNITPLFLTGDAGTILRRIPSESIDCCITSPPYWNQREYDGKGIGLEDTPQEYVNSLLLIVDELRRILKPTGSFWLNIGDTYKNKSLLGIPWRIALAMTDTRDWVLRNSVIWHKVKGGLDNSKDKLRNVHEHVFHFTKSSKYFYDADAIRSTPSSARVVNGAVVSATGVSGVRYRRQIELSTALDATEKTEAFEALEKILNEIRQGRLADFRMIIRGQQRTTHSDAERVSGRAKEINDKGFYFLRYHPNGSKPSDVWDIIPEDTQRRTNHFAPFPEDLCRIPIRATCPPNGIVLDPFCGTGTAMSVAVRLGRKSIGIDISHEYIREAERRCQTLL